ncbi:type II secretion system protein [Candidatus Uhrbacteria bacterium]|nr:type II secretion system protein [Candidatus Uhrbacteria bacterium]
MNNHKKGFTLIELLVVIAIISILGSIVLASLETARAKGRDARRMQETRSVAIALELYKDTYGNYPCASPYQTSLDSNFLQPLLDEGLLSGRPQDPVNVYPYVYVYASYKTIAGGPCGQYAELNYDIEAAGTPCVLSGGFVSASHCHIFLPEAMPCLILPSYQTLGTPCMALQD